jgi:hypothetical protein
MVEYAAFASSWLVPDSNELFNPQCDLNNDTFIDLADFAEFCDSWLWTACWRLDLQALVSQLMIMDGGDNVVETSSFGMYTESEMLYSAQSLQIESVVQETSLEQQILNLQDTIAFLEQIWLEEPDLQQEISTEDWQEFVDSVYRELSEMTTNYEQ